jgi:hypothetical protein
MVAYMSCLYVSLICRAYMSCFTCVWIGEGAAKDGRAGDCAVHRRQQD